MFAGWNIKRTQQDLRLLTTRRACMPFLDIEACVYCPRVDAQQCADIIDRVTAKYPEFEQQWSGQSSFGTQFISLELNEERPRQ
jgi:hypothetical protein